MRVHVAFTPAEAAAASIGLVVDVLRTTSTLVQALDAGFTAAYCCAEVEEARTLRAELRGAVLAGERRAVRIPGFDAGNSPRELLAGDGGTLVLTTTNGTRAIVAAAEACDQVLAASLLNLDAVVEAVRRRGGDVAVLCAGVEGAFALDDAYCAGRIVDELGGEHTDAALAAARLARSFWDAEEALAASRTAATLREAGLGDDVAWCARESVCAAVPVFTGMRGRAARLERGS